MARKLKMTAQGGWDLVFSKGHYCGKANDGIGIMTYTYISKRTQPGDMQWVDVGVLSRKDIKRLRDFCNEVLSTRARINPLKQLLRKEKYAKDKTETLSN